MSKAWYVVHTYSGYENKVQKHVRMLVDKGTLKDHVFDVKVPSEEVVEIKDGHKKVSTKKFLPGYIMVEMDLPDPGWKEVCQEIRKIPGVTGFVGSNRNQKPQPEALSTGTSGLTSAPAGLGAQNDSDHHYREPQYEKPICLGFQREGSRPYQWQQCPEHDR